MAPFHRKQAEMQYKAVQDHSITSAASVPLALDAGAQVSVV